MGRDDDDCIRAGGGEDFGGELIPDFEEGILLTFERERSGAVSDGEDWATEFLWLWFNVG